MCGPDSSVSEWSSYVKTALVFTGICWWLDVNIKFDDKWLRSQQSMRRRWLTMVSLYFLYLSSVIQNVQYTLTITPAKVTFGKFSSSQPVRASVLNALQCQHGSSVTDNQQLATEMHVGRIHGVAPPATFVTPVTSCRRHLINEVGCVCQRTWVLSHIAVSPCPHSPSPSSLPPTHTSPHHPSPHCLPPCALLLYNNKSWWELHRTQLQDLQNSDCWKKVHQI